MRLRLWINAVRAAQKYAQEGKDFVVDIDITKFFDHVNHDILRGRPGRNPRHSTQSSVPR